MKKLLFILLILLSTYPVLSQKKIVTDSLFQTKSHIPDSIFKDSLKSDMHWQGKIDGLSPDNLVSDFLRLKYDGLRAESLYSVTGAQELIGNSGDSLKVIIDSPKSILEGMQHKQQQNLTEISGILDGKLQDENTGIEGNLNNKITTSGISDLKVDKLIDSAPDAGLIDNLGLTENQIAHIEINDSKAPSLGGVAQEIITDDLGGGLNDINIDENIKEVISIDIEQDLNKPLEKAGEIEGLKEVQNNISDVNKYNQDVKALKEGDLSSVESKIEEQAIQMSELRELERQKAVIEKYQDEQRAQLEEYQGYANKDQLIAAAKEKGKGIAIDHFGVPNQKGIIGAHKMLFGLKQKYTYVPSVKKLTEERQRPDNLREKPVIDRFLVGLDLETVASDGGVNKLDVAPYIGYKLNERINIYVSHIWKYRIVKDDHVKMSRTSSIVGYRGAINYHLWKDFYATGIVEQLHKTFFTSDNNKGVKKDNGYMIGLSKQYKIVKAIYGQGQILYNLAHRNDGLYQRPYNVRFGFYLNTSSRNKIQKKGNF